ncbi:transcription/translation regulatory transformer protein RfaH [Idiomarina seosinensis]|uniref:transcription/translation regulatory transformer protein RfaH n=1 Tax=Idiomarina seosinensis TaxID=281739 RepID=UPI00384A9AEC
MDSDAWYVLKTKPKQEIRAVQNLENQGFEAYCPKLTVEKIQRGSRKKVVEAMFPGYVFVHPDDLMEQFYKLRSTYGVASVLRFGDNIPQIPGTFIEQLKQLDNRPEEQAPAVGDEVEIKAGPFKGFMAKIIKLDGESRCFVMLDWMQKQVTAHFSYRDLAL